MNIEKIKELTNEIDLLSSLNEKFIVGHWYKDIDTLREETYYFKVTETKDEFIYFKSLCGKLELIDPQLEGNAFMKGCLLYSRSKKISFKEAEEAIKNHLKQVIK